LKKALRRILLVEDDRDVQIVASMSLAEVGGFEVCVCGSAAEALKAAPGFAPDLILMDVIMPGVDGPRALSELRLAPKTASTPVVFLTGRIQPAEVARYRGLGCLDVIPKPFDPATLPEVLMKIWDRHDA
jgi:two-component system, OmpR family, response regulator